MTSTLGPCIQSGRRGAFNNGIYPLVTDAIALRAVLRRRNTSAFNNGKNAEGEEFS